MNTTAPSRRVLLTRGPAALAAGLLLALAGGCATQTTTTGSEAARGQIPTLSPTTPVLDGQIGEWGDTAVAADGRYLYLRWTTGIADFPPQAAPYTTAVYLDVDGDASTGRQQTFHTSGPLGIDLEILFSPSKDGQPGTGVQVFTLDSAGGRTSHGHADIDLSFAPTHSADWYEARLTRALPDTLPAAGVRSAGQAAGLFVTLDPAGVITGFSDEFRAVLPPADPAPPAGQPAASIPAKPDGAVRVISFNVLRSGPSVRPEPFRRLITALNPDVLLVQEWDQTQTIAPWFESLPGGADGSTPWHVRTGPGGVAIISRHALEPIASDELRIDTPPGDQPRSWPVRFVAAKARTDAGELVLSSVHFKCCGSAHSPEDRARAAEARAVNQELARVSAGTPVILGGDINLVGSRPPLDTLRAGLDTDGSELDVAPARVLGDAAYYTWSDAKSPFSPGRLDFVVLSDSKFRAASAFVLDTARLAPPALRASGLQADDTAQASDHLPVVVDLVRRD